MEKVTVGTNSFSLDRYIYLDEGAPRRNTIKLRVPLILAPPRPLASREFVHRSIVARNR